MIVLYNPQSCVEGRRRLPLPLLALGSQLPDDAYEIVDGNVLGGLAPRRARGAAAARPRAAASSPSPRCRATSSATRSSTRAGARAGAGPAVVWGGYFPSLHTDVVLRSPLVDAVVRGQGEETLRRVAGGARAAARRSTAIAGLSWKERASVRHNPDRPFAALDEFPEFPYHKLGDMEEYVIRTYLGERTLCHITSRGCPFPCNFCAITEVYQRRWLAEEPERVGARRRALRARAPHRLDRVLRRATSWPPRRARWPSPSACGRSACAGGARRASTP